MCSLKTFVEYVKYPMNITLFSYTPPSIEHPFITHGLYLYKRVHVSLLLLFLGGLAS